MRERPGMMYRLTAMHHYDQRPFATDEIDQKLEESIYGEGLSDPERHVSGETRRVRGLEKLAS